MNKAFFTFAALIVSALNLAAQSSAPAGEAVDIREIRGPVEIPQPAGWEPWLLAAVATLALAAAAWWLLRKTKRRARARIQTAHQRALADLAAARDLMDQSSSRDYAFAVSDALRRFIEARFRLPSMRQTSEEFLRAATEHECGLGAYAPTLADFMQFCDLGKFGKWQLNQVTMTAMQASAFAVVNAELNEPLQAGATRPSSAENISGASAPAAVTAH
jgi:hypothetical protein